MAGSLDAYSNGFLTPAPSQVTVSSNYLSAGDFDFISQYLPELDPNQFERFGPRTVAGFLKLTGAEIPFASDLIKWTEQGRLHTKYETVTHENGGFTTNSQDEFSIASGTCTFRVGQTVFLSSASKGVSEKAVVTAVGAGGATTTNTAQAFRVAYYGDDGGSSPFNPASDVVVFAYGAEFKKGTDGMSGALDAEFDVYEVKPIIIKDRYEVNGSDLSQISWVEVNAEDGATGYFWFLQSESETRLRFDDYMEMALIEGVPAENGSAAENELADASVYTETKAGTDGLFYAIEQRGNVWSGGNPTAMSDFDLILQRMDKQGGIEENLMFVNRAFSLDIDDMLAAQNSYGAGGTSYGVFQNSEDMALNLGFDGFKRGGYEFYKTDWKYLNDPTLRGDITTGGVNGVMVPAGKTTVYDQVLGKNATRPFLHVRYRSSEHENRRYKSWVTGSAGGARTSSEDKMTVDFLTERALCTMGANNFFIFNA
jgi:hypothetical protein